VFAMNLFRKQEKPFLTDVAQHVGAYRGQSDGLKWWEVKDNQAGPFTGILEQVQQELSSCASIDRCRIILVDLFLRGRTMETSVACVMIGGTTQKQRKKAVKLLRRSSLLERYPGLNIEEWESPPHVPNIIIAGDKDKPADDSPIYQNSDFSLSHIFLPLPPEEPDEGEFPDDSSSDSDSELELMRSGSVTPAYLRSESEDATSDVVLPVVPPPTNPISLREPVLDRQNVEIFSIDLDYALLSVPQGLNLTEQLSEISRETVVKVKNAEVSFTTPNNGAITEHGSLLDFFEKKSPPYKPDEILSFWTSFAGLAEGLALIHEQRGSTGLHSDLKPANIIISSVDDPSFNLKIRDFGFSHIAPKNKGPDGSKAARNIDQWTSQTYAPPEYVLTDEIKRYAGSEFDLWSLGCIFLECAVWVSLGERGRLDFIKDRIRETDNRSDNMKSDRGDCFHDGTGVLRCVREFGQHIRDHGRRDDETTSQIFDLALRELLVEKYKRRSARYMYSAMKAIIDTEAHRRTNSFSNAKNGVLTRRHGSITEPPMVASPISEEEHISPDTSRTDPEARSPGSESNLEMSTAEHGSSQKESPTIDDISKWIRKKKINGNTSELPGWESVQAQLKGRDFIFVIDNCETMQVYEDQVKAFVHCLAYLVKRLDPDGAEIMCTSDPMTRAKYKNSTGHSNFVAENFSRGKGGHCNMEFALEKALDPIGDQLQNSVSKGNNRRTSLRSFPGRLIGRQRPVTVIVFTDGVWGSSIGGGAENPIESLIRKMRDHGVSRSTVAIQFLNFGSDPVGRRRLEYLDDDLPNKDRNSGIDIVDTKAVTESIWDILIGAVDEHVDGTIRSRTF
ncbi:unnamed protein product, partial [Clonostachys rhizophaga]